ncbi:DUF3304 domain-containing protein [Stutzerimonas urumqiensis]|uniref:DUF3304 domain-containing protein n=1 Tax=Stutzerimonas urumqiensis TaxID=638269 RepID=UPI003BAB6AB2
MKVRAYTPIQALTQLTPANLSQRWLNLPKALRLSLLALCWLGLIAAPLIWQYVTPPGAALYGHNHTDRPIFDYTVNGNWGGNGGVTCCWTIKSDVLEVAWIKDRTGEQVRRGIKEERRQLKIPNPPRKRTDDTLHVHFLPGDQVRVAWSDSHTSPLKKEINTLLGKEKP